MFDDEEELSRNIVYKPCKNCKRTDYDNADVKEPEFTDDGKVEVEPDKCDKCDFNLMLSDSDLIH
jgi:hypothetical protein